MRKGTIILWKLFSREIDGEWSVDKGRIYGRMPDCVKTRLTREYRKLYGTDIDVVSRVGAEYGNGIYSVLVYVVENSRKDLFLKSKGFTKF